MAQFHGPNHLSSAFRNLIHRDFIEDTIEYQDVKDLIPNFIEYAWGAIEQLARGEKFVTQLSRRDILKTAFSAFRAGIENVAQILLSANSSYKDKLEAYGEIISATDAIKNAYQVLDRSRGTDYFEEYRERIEGFERDLREIGTAELAIRLQTDNALGADNGQEIHAKIAQHLDSEERKNRREVSVSIPIDRHSSDRPPNRPSGISHDLAAKEAPPQPVADLRR